MFIEEDFWTRDRTRHLQPRVKGNAGVKILTFPLTLITLGTFIMYEKMTELEILMCGIQDKTHLMSDVASTLDREGASSRWSAIFNNEKLRWNSMQAWSRFWAEAFCIADQELG